jgi:hypothetical protein
MFLIGRKQAPESAIVNAIVSQASQADTIIKTLGLRRDRLGSVYLFQKFPRPRNPDRWDWYEPG